MVFFSLLTCVLLTLSSSVWGSDDLVGARAPALPYKHIDNKLPMMRKDLKRATTSSSYPYPEPGVAQTDIFDEQLTTYFILNVTLGTQDMLLVLDAGSSDTWMAMDGFTCTNFTTNAVIPESECQFPSTFTPGPSFEQIPDVNFNITYGDLEYVNGIFGYDNITVAGLTFRQQIGLATKTNFVNGIIYSSILGMGFPVLGDEYRGTNYSADNFTASSHIIYSDVPNTIFYVENLTDPIWSFTPTRNPVADYRFGGYLTFGGIPDIYDPVLNATGDFTTVPLVPFDWQDLPGKYTFYTANVTACVFGNYTAADGAGATTYLFDTGNPMIYATEDVAVAYGQLFDPPAQNVSGNLIVDCNSTAPDFSLVLGNTTFFINPADLIWNAGPTNGTDVCYAGVQPGGVPGSLASVGLPFFTSALTVFDWEHDQLAFSARPYYEVPDAGQNYG